jgi:hypothetical protein
MKKTLITAIFLQCLGLYGMQAIPTGDGHQIQDSPVTILVSVNYFDNEIRRFGQNITSEINNVKSGAATVEHAIVSITGNCRSWFDLCRTQINEKYGELVVAQQQQKQLEVQGIIRAKNQEILALRQRLDTLLSTHTEGLESLRAQLRMFDQQSVEAEQQVRTARERVDLGNTGELVTEAQLTRTMNRLTRDLETIKSEIQIGKRDLEDAFSRAEEKYSDSIEILLRSLENRYADILSGVAERSSEKITHLTEAYEHQIELIQHMLDEAVAATKAAEEKRELITKIGNICSRNQLNPATSIITQRSSDILAMNVFQKRSTVDNIYQNRFVLFQELLPATELDLIRQYISSTEVGEMPIRPTHIPDIFIIRNFRRAPGGWCWGNIYLSDMQLLINKHGMRKDIALAWRGNGTAQIIGDNDWIERANLAEYSRCRNLENTERDLVYDREVAQYNARKIKAESAPFPSVVFDNLIGRVNGFFKQLI